MSLNQLFDQFIGGQQNPSGPTAQATGGASNIANKIPGGMLGGLAAGGVLGLLAGNKKMRKSATKMAGGAVGLGGAAVLGAVAYNAYKNWQGNKAGTANTEQPQQLAHLHQQAAPTMQELQTTGFDPQHSIGADGHPFQLALIKAMIAAANADGHIDSEEQKRVFEAVNKMNLEPADKAVVFDTLQNPPDIEEIASLATGMEQATEIYLASSMAIDPDHPGEKAYLADLANKLRLPDGLALHLETQLEAEASHAA